MTSAAGHADVPVGSTTDPAESESVEVLHEGDWLRLCRRGRWEYAERTHGDGFAVAILATTPDDDVLFVQQTRVPLDTETIEFPAGLVGDTDRDDDIVGAAGRELVEETGWEAGHIELVVTGATSPGLTNETVGFVRATDLRRVGPGGGVDHEDIVVHEVARHLAGAWLGDRLADGLVVDLKVWSGLWLVEHGLGEPTSR